MMKIIEIIKRWEKKDINGVRKDREIEHGEKKMREEFDGDTGRNDEHKGVNVTGNQFYQ